MDLTNWTIFVAVFGVAMIFVYMIKYKGMPIDVWTPGVAWTRALIYFSFCNIVIAASGTLEQLLDQPIFTEEQLANPLWMAYCVFCFAYVFVAYWVMWARMTVTFDRKYYLGSEIVFGLIWGFSTGGLLLSFSTMKQGIFMESFF
jgi:hypothetical protein